MVKLQVGKKYVAKDGEVVGPFKQDEATGAFVLANGKDNARDYEWWFPTGRYLFNRESQHDLVEEFKDKEKWLKEGEYYNYIKMPPNGAALLTRCVNVTGDKAIMQIWRKLNINGAVDADDFYTTVVPAENAGGHFRPLVEFPPAVEEQEELEAIAVLGEQLF